MNDFVLPTNLRTKNEKSVCGNIMTDDVDEEDFDDPIRLFENEHSRVFYSKLKNIVIEDPGIKIEPPEGEYKTSEEIRSCCRKDSTLLPISFFDNEQNITLLTKCRPLCIKVVDCMKTTSFNVNKSKTKDFEQDVERSASKKQIINLSSVECEYEEKYMSKTDIDKYKQILKSKMAAFYHKKFDKVTKHVKQNETVNTVFQFPFPGKVKNNDFETTSTLIPREHCNKTIYTSNGEIIPHICDTDMKLYLKAGSETLKKNNFINTDGNQIAPILNQKSQSNSKQIFQIESVITNRNPQKYNPYLTNKINKTLKIPPVNNGTTYLSPKIISDIKETHKLDHYFYPIFSSNLVNVSEKPNHLFINQLQSPLISINNQEMSLNTRSCTPHKNHEQTRNNLMYVPNSNYPNTGNVALTINKPLDNKNMYDIADKHLMMAKALDYSIRDKVLESNEKIDGQNDSKNNLNDTHSAHKSKQNHTINSNKVIVIVPNISITNEKVNHNNQEAENKKSYNINKQNCVRNSECRKTIDTLKKPENTCKGYSPPILPIPTYEKVFQVISKIKFFYFEGDKMFINADSDNDYKDIPMQNLPQQPIIKPSNKRKITDEQEKVPRKITINEYKRRLTSTKNNIIINNKDPISNSDKILNN